ncbi:MAG: transporter [Acidobacteriia bacterium]|nr:transporter [Terriglobia bacterium]
MNGTVDRTRTDDGLRQQEWHRQRAWTLRLVLLLIQGVLAARNLGAQNPPIAVNPNRPTFASPALTTQAGVAEVEWGVLRSALRSETSAFSTPTLLKLGLATDLELRISTNGFLRFGPAGASSVTGFADVALGAQWCYLHQDFLGTDQTLQVTHKFATADAEKGLGSGAADDTVVLIFSRDVGASHVDVNVLYTWLGRTLANGGGRIEQPAATIAVSHVINEGWSFGGEVYGIGGTPSTPRTVSNLWYAGYKVSPRLVLDGGIDIGLSKGAQRYSAFAGLTYGIGRFRRL